METSFSIMKLYNMECEHHGTNFVGRIFYDERNEFLLCLWGFLTFLRIHDSKMLYTLNINFLIRY